MHVLFDAVICNVRLVYLILILNLLKCCQRQFSFDIKNALVCKFPCLRNGGEEYPRNGGSANMRSLREALIIFLASSEKTEMGEC